MKIYWTLTLFLLCNFLFSQYDVDVVGNAETWNNSGLWVVNKKASSKIAGSYLLFGDSNNYGIITTTMGRRFRVPKLNYNVKQDQMEAKISNDSIFIFDSKTIEMVEINKRLIRRYIDSELSSNGYFEVVATCKEMELIKKYKVIIKEGIINPLTRQKQTSDSYVIKSEYFIYKNNIMNEITLKKGKLLKVFGDDSEKIKNYSSENNLSFRKEEDLKLIFDYHSTL